MLYHERYYPESGKNLETDSHVYFLIGPFSQWYGGKEGEAGQSTFTDHGDRNFPWDDGIVRTFTCAEQFMMFHKAKMFGADDVAEKIMTTSDPNEHKTLGRSVTGFDVARWSEMAQTIVIQGNRYKFGQNPPLAQLLMETHPKTLVEAAHYDPVWGVGLRASDPLILDERNWKGQNLLGKSLMSVRAELLEQSRTASAQVTSAEPHGRVDIAPPAKERGV